MNCKYHNNLKGTNTCCVCGDWICDDCVLEIDGRVYCKDCLKNKLKNEKTSQNNINNINNTFYSKKVYKSGFLTFIFSVCFPGTGQMYLGYTKRGLTILSLFLLGLYIDLFSPLIMLTWIFGLFDAFKLKSNLEKGIYQEDSIVDIKNFIRDNKFFMAVLALIIIVPFCLELFEDIFDIIFGGPIHTLRHSFNFNKNGIRISLNLEDMFELGISAIFVFFVFFFIIKFFKKRSNKNNIDDTNTPNNNNTFN